jgi:cobalamin synthase
MLVLAGLLAVLAGVALMFFDRIPFLGKLPGDITIKRENVQIYFPIASSIILSIVISVIAWLFSHFRGK